MISYESEKEKKRCKRERPLFFAREILSDVLSFFAANGFKKRTKQGLD